jgi:hypothetical protein
MPMDMLADFAVSGEDADHPFGNAGFGEQLAEQVAIDRGLRGGLEYDRAAREQGGEPWSQESKARNEQTKYKSGNS